MPASRQNPTLDSPSLASQEVLHLIQRRLSLTNVVPPPSAPVDSVNGTFAFLREVFKTTCLVILPEPRPPLTLGRARLGDFTEVGAFDDLNGRYEPWD